MRRIITTVASIALPGLALTGCGGDSDSAGEENVTELTLGVLPVADYAPAFYAEAKGLFEDQGLDVTVTTIQGGANSVPALLNGDFSIAVTNWTSYVQALSEDIPVRAVLPAAQGGPGVSGIVVPGDSDIEKATDLAGKTVAVNNLKSIGELFGRLGLEENGQDPDDVKFTELPFPDMPAALAKGTIDAAWVIEPFLSQTTGAGAKVIVDPFAGELNGMPLGGYAASEEFAEANPETLDKFAAAVREATEALSDDNEFREFLPTFSGLSPEAASVLTLPTTQTSLDESSLDSTMSYMVEYGWIDDEVDVDSALDYLRDAG